MSSDLQDPRMNEERDNETGKFASKYDDDDFLTALEELDGLAGTSDVAEAVGCPQRTAYNRLDTLRDQGVVESRKAGRSVVWLLSDDEGDR